MQSIGLILQQTSFFETHIPILCHDHVIQHFNIKQLAGLQQCLGHRNIFSRGCSVSGRMVVRHNQTSTITPDRLFEQLRQPHQGRIHTALVVEHQHRQDRMRESSKDSARSCACKKKKKSLVRISHRAVFVYGSDGIRTRGLCLDRAAC